MSLAEGAINHLDWKCLLKVKPKRSAFQGFNNGWPRRISADLFLTNGPLHLQIAGMLQENTFFV